MRARWLILFVVMSLAVASLGGCQGMRQRALERWIERNITGGLDLPDDPGDAALTGPAWGKVRTP